MSEYFPKIEISFTIIIIIIMPLWFFFMSLFVKGIQFKLSLKGSRQKKVLFLVAGPLRGGEGLTGLPLRKKKFF